MSPKINKRKILRIFQVISASTNSIVSANRTWYRNLYEPLVEMGHDVLLVSAEQGERAMVNNNSRLRSRFTQNLYDTFKRENNRKPFDLFFAYFKEGMVESEFIDEVRKADVPTCNFSCNNTHQFYLVEKIATKFDFNLHSEKDARKKFLKIGANPIWWPMASNPKYFKPENCKRNVDVSFVGANYAIRARYIKFLLEQGIDVHTYGPGWLAGSKTTFHSMVKRYFLALQSLLAYRIDDQIRASAKLSEHDLRRSIGKNFPFNVHPPVSDEELISLYSKSKISLGFLEVHDNHDPSQRLLRHTHLREYEAPMCGALYCTGYLDELAEMFEPDKEMLMYREDDELLDKVRYFLQNEAGAEKIRHAGHLRALKDHTYHKRFKQLFNEIGLS